MTMRWLWVLCVIASSGCATKEIVTVAGACPPPPPVPQVLMEPADEANSSWRMESFFEKFEKRLSGATKP